MTRGGWLSRRMNSVPIRPVFFFHSLKISRLIQSEEISQGLIGWVKTCLDGSLVSGWTEALRWDKSVGDGRECLFLILRPSRSWVESFNDSMGISRLPSGVFHSLEWRWRWWWFGMSLFFSSTRRRTFGYERCVCVPTRPRWNRSKGGSNGGRGDDRLHLPCRLTLPIESLSSVGHHEDGHQQQPLVLLLLLFLNDRLLNDEEKRSLIEHLRADQFFSFVDSGRDSPIRQITRCLTNACHSRRERRFPRWRISPKNVLLDVALQSSIVNRNGNFLLIRSFRSVHRWRWSWWESFPSSTSLRSACLSPRHCHSLSRWYLRFSFWSIRMIQRSIGDEKSIEHRYLISTSLAAGSKVNTLLRRGISLELIDRAIAIRSDEQRCSPQSCSPSNARANGQIPLAEWERTNDGEVMDRARLKRTEDREDASRMWRTLGERERRVAKGQLKWWSRGKKRRTSSIDRARQTFPIPIPIRLKMFTLTSVCWSPSSPCQRCSAQTKSPLLSRRLMSNGACPAEQREREIWRDFLFVFVFLFPWPMCQLCPPSSSTSSLVFFPPSDPSDQWSPLFLSRVNGQDRVIRWPEEVKRDEREMQLGWNFPV